MKKSIKILLTIFILAIIAVIILTYWISLKEALKGVFGIIFVIFVPGFAWSYVFFKENKIDVLGRMVLSIALSVALTTLMIYYSNILGGILINERNSFLIILGITVVGLMTHFYTEMKSSKRYDK
ncbi:DUF1616 domain-containing protein [Candidatus Peregrinibacteria bacterium]|nr:DUF1616 domain-containing protein [Candidatus Peregrinibacteria bacterium]